jgi:hypothetical protein
MTPLPDVTDPQAFTGRTGLATWQPGLVGNLVSFHWRAEEGPDASGGCR